MVHDLPVILLSNAIHFHRVRLVDEIEQNRKGIAKIETPATSVADIEYAFELVEQRLLIVEVVGSPVQGMACGRLEAAFSFVHGIPRGETNRAGPVRGPARRPCA